MAPARNSLAALGLAIACAVTPALGDELGTLFHSPKERADLERKRRGEPVEGTGRAAIVRPDPAVTGYVKRSDGKSTVFIDQQPYPVRSEKLQDLLEPGAVRKHVPRPALPPSDDVPPVPPAAPVTPSASDTPPSRSGDRPRT